MDKSEAANYFAYPGDLKRLKAWNSSPDVLQAESAKVSKRLTWRERTAIAIGVPMAIAGLGSMLAGVVGTVVDVTASWASLAVMGGSAGVVSGVVSLLTGMATSYKSDRVQRAAKHRAAELRLEQCGRYEDSRYLKYARQRYVDVRQSAVSSLQRKLDVVLSVLAVGGVSYLAFGTIEPGAFNNPVLTASPLATVVGGAALCAATGAVRTVLPKAFSSLDPDAALEVDRQAEEFSKSTERELSSGRGRQPIEVNRDVGKVERMRELGPVRDEISPDYGLSPDVTRPHRRGDFGIGL